LAVIGANRNPGFRKAAADLRTRDLADLSTRALSRLRHTGGDELAAAGV